MMFHPIDLKLKSLTPIPIMLHGQAGLFRHHSLHVMKLLEFGNIPHNYVISSHLPAMSAQCLCTKKESQMKYVMPVQ